MKTRALTTDETARLDAARDMYLNGTTGYALTSLEVAAAWDTYVSYRQEHDIIGTLFGYRKRLVSA